MKKSLFAYRDYELWWLLLQVRRAMRKIRERELWQYEITPEEVGVLVVVQAIGKRATPAEISRRLLREPHSVSTLLSRMEKKGLVRKVKDLERKNLVRVVLNEKGRKAYQQSAERESIHRIMSYLSEDERQQLRMPLEKLCNELHKELGIKRKEPFPTAE